MVPMDLGAIRKIVPMKFRRCLWKALSFRSSLGLPLNLFPCMIVIIFSDARTSLLSTAGSNKGLGLNQQFEAVFLIPPQTWQISKRIPMGLALKVPMQICHLCRACRCSA